MIHSLVVYIETTLLPLGAWGVFLATLIEQIIAPIPSAFVQLGGGFFLVHTESFTSAFLQVLMLVSLPSAVAVCIGATLVYYVAFFLGKPFVDRAGRFLGTSWSDVERLQEKFSSSRKDDLLLLLLRSIPAVPTVAIDIFCGTIRYPIMTYIGITFVGTFIRATIFGLIGWWAGDVYVQYASYIASAEKYVLVVAGILLVAFLVFKKRNKKVYNKNL